MLPAASATASWSSGSPSLRVDPGGPAAPARRRRRRTDRRAGAARAACTASSSRAPGSRVELAALAGRSMLTSRGDPRGVAVVEHQRVAVGVAEERHVAHARVERVAGEGHALRLERRARRFDVVDVQRDRVALTWCPRPIFSASITLERQVAGLELGEVALRACTPSAAAPASCRRTPPPRSRSWVGTATKSTPLTSCWVVVMVGGSSVG